MADQITVIFDGRCGMCTRTIQSLLRLDRHNRLRIVPCQAIDGVERFGITPTQCDESVWTIDESGNAIAGGQAAMQIFSALVGNDWPGRVGQLPLIRQALDGGYRLIARNRRRFPGTTPWCEQHPDECTAESRDRTCAAG